MSFDPAAFARVAAQITTPKTKPGEEHIRTACGRAYYAAFLTARERLIAKGHPLPSDGTVHGKVLTILTGAEDRDVRALGHELQNFKGFRHDADYVLAGPYRSGVRFEQWYGALLAKSAHQWIDRFSGLAQSKLPSK